MLLDLAEPIRQTPVIDGYVLNLLDPTTLEVDIRKECTLNALFMDLQQAGIQVQSMRNKQNRLEQLFLDMLNNHRERKA